MATTTTPVSPDSTDVEQQTAGLVASFSSSKKVLKTVQTLRSLGFERIDVHSPHPVHGLDDALGLRGSPLPWGAIAGASVGFGGGLWMAWWMNAVDYPFLISGKPLFSIFPSLPIAFELAVLCAAFVVFVGTIAFGGLPKLANEKFRIPSFARATDDQYLLAIDVKDKRYDELVLRTVLEELGGTTIESIPAVDEAETKIPRALWMAAIVLGVVALIPAALIAKARNSTSTKPRYSFVSNMDHQPKFKAQTASGLFADGRSMRGQVAGTVARGDLREDDRFYLGIEPTTDARDETDSQPDPQDGDLNVAFIQDDRPSPPEATDNEKPSATSDQVNWVTSFPLAVDESLLRRGQQRYGIFCATCHGQGGDGDGLVTLRALELEQGTWVKPTSLHAEPIRKQAVGQLFHTVSNGVRKMPGYASQIPVRDRWAIVAYLRALQRTRTATPSDVPSDVLTTMRELN